MLVDSDEDNEQQEPDLKRYLEAKSWQRQLEQKLEALDKVEQEADPSRKKKLILPIIRFDHITLFTTQFLHVFGRRVGAKNDSTRARTSTASAQITRR